MDLVDAFHQSESFMRKAPTIGHATPNAELGQSTTTTLNVCTHTTTTLTPSIHFCWRKRKKLGLVVVVVVVVVVCLFFGIHGARTQHAQTGRYRTRTSHESRRKQDKVRRN